MDIAGKIVAITGASSRIGRATAMLVAEHGAFVVLGARAARHSRLPLMKLPAAAEGLSSSLPMFVADAISRNLSLSRSNKLDGST